VTDLFESGWGLSLIVFLPLVGAGMVLLVPKAQEKAAKYVALLSALGAFALSVAAIARFDFGGAERFQLGTDLSWPMLEAAAKRARTEDTGGRLQLEDLLRPFDIAAIKS